MPKPTISPIDFIDRVIKLNEKGLPWKLSPYQRRVLELAFRRGTNGALVYRVITLSEPWSMTSYGALSWNPAGAYTRS